MNENIRMGTVNDRAELQEALETSIQAIGGEAYPEAGEVEPCDDRCDEAMARPVDGYGQDAMVTRDPNSSENKIREFSVKELNYGFIVKVGCHSFAISTAVETGKMITEYLKDPQGTEQKWYKNELSLKRNR